MGGSSGYGYIYYSGYQRKTPHFSNMIRRRFAVANSKPILRGLISCMVSALVVVVLLFGCLAGNNANVKASEINADILGDTGGSAEWYVFALRCTEGEAYTASSGGAMASYRQSLTTLIKTAPPTSYVTRQKLVLSLLACDMYESADSEVKAFVSDTLDNSIGSTGIMSYIFGLHMLNNGLASAGHTAQSVIDTIIERQLDSGAWAVVASNADVDATAMALAALAPHYLDSDSARYTQVREAADKALTFLAAAQGNDGSFRSYGVSNAESSAQVMIALASMQITNDSRFVKNGISLLEAIQAFRLDDGSYAHTIPQSGEPAYSQIATSQVLCAIAANTTQKSPYVFTAASQTEPPTATATATVPSATLPTPTATVENATAAPTTHAEQFFTDVPNSLDPLVPTPSTLPQNTALKLIICAVLVVVAAIIVVVLRFRNVRSRAVFIIIAVVLCAAVLFVMLSDIQKGSDYYGNDADNGAASSTTDDVKTETVTFSVFCNTVRDDGVLVDKVSYTIEEGDTVYDLLVRAAKQHGLHTDITASGYVRAIDNLYEHDYGGLSGWIYMVNGKMPNVGCKECVVSAGDVIEWHYSLEMGADIGSTK